MATQQRSLCLSSSLSSSTSASRSGSRQLPSRFALALLTALLLNACGGGGSSSNTAAVTDPVAPVLTAAPGTTATPAPVAAPGTPPLTGNTATDGFNWFNYRRQLLGEPPLVRTATIDTAAQNHSQYQQLNNTISHEQVAGKPGFTGAVLLDRLQAANFRFTRSSYAYGEVISSTSDASGVNAAEDLITAIYHRFASFEPMFRLGGTGSAVSSSGRTYFTVDLVADGLDAALGRGKFLVYPADGQQGLPPVFFSDYESPDPVAGRNQVGYPISIHADITSTVAVTSFTVRARGGNILPAQLLAHASDPQTPASAAALIPLDVLASNTTYDVQFAGTVDGTAVTRAWSFTTR